MPDLLIMRVSLNIALFIPERNVFVHIVQVKLYLFACMFSLSYRSVLNSHLTTSCTLLLTADLIPLSASHVYCPVSRHPALFHVYSACLEFVT